MRMCALSFPIILALALIQLPGAWSAWANNAATLPPSPSFLPQSQSNTSPQQSPPAPLQMLRPLLYVPPTPVSFLSTKPPTKKAKQSDADKAAKDARKAVLSAVGAEGNQYFYGGPIRKFNLVFPPGALETAKAKPFTEEWVRCSIEVDFGSPSMTRYDGVGCRFKGSVGSLRMCIDRVTGQPNGACRKLSWKVDATRFLEPDANGVKPLQRIKGLKELAFGGLPVDLSLLTERLSAGLLKSSGIVGFRANYALLHINGQSDGVYSLLEQPGDLFTQEHWSWDAEQGNGALYKEVLFRETSDEEYFKEHRVSGSNEDDFMVEVTNAILDAFTDEQKHAVIDTYFDEKSFVDSTAFNTIIGNTDDWRQRHNFYWYVLTTTEPSVSPNGKPKKVRKLVMVPADYDRINDGNTARAGLGGAPKHWYDPISPDLCKQVDQTPEQRAARQPRAEYEYWLSLFSQYPPNVGKPINCDHFTKVFSVLARQVNQRIVELANGPMSASKVDPMMENFAAQIAHLPGLDPDPPNRPEWMEGRASLRDHLNRARTAAVSEARSELAKPDVAGTSIQGFASWAAPAAPQAKSQPTPQSQPPPAPQAAPSFAGFQPKQAPVPAATASMSVSSGLFQPKQASPPPFATNAESVTVSSGQFQIQQASPAPFSTNAESTSAGSPTFQLKQAAPPSFASNSVDSATTNSFTTFQSSTLPASFAPRDSFSMSASSSSFPVAPSQSSNLDISVRSSNLFPLKLESSPAATAPATMNANFASFQPPSPSVSSQFPAWTPPSSGFAAPQANAWGAASASLPAFPQSTSWNSAGSLPPVSTGWTPATSTFGLFQPKTAQG